MRDDADFDAVVDAVARRLQAGGSIPLPTPKIGPDPERPLLPWDPLDEGPLQPLPRRQLRIAGMELTQSIQHFGAAGESFGADNSVPLVALKTLVARVYPYVRPGLAWPNALTGERVTGELVLSIGNRVIYRTGPTRSDGARIGPSKDLLRTLWDRERVAGLIGGDGPAVGIKRLNCSLNFVVPAYYCRRGQMHVAVRIWVMAGGALQFGQDSATLSQYIQFLGVRAPKIALVRVNWVNSFSGEVIRPTDEEMLGTMRLAERMLPFPYFETTILSSEKTLPGMFYRYAGSKSCNQDWNDLLTELRLTRIFTALFQLGDIVFAMVPAASIPGERVRLATSGSKDSINSGCGSADGVGACFTGAPYTFAHEFGHIYDRKHVGVKGGENDPDYPNYGGSKTSIGEVGIDAGATPRALFDPLSTGDIMSYEGKQWISPYTYRAILDARHTHQSAPADPSRVRPLLVAQFRLHRTERGLTGVEVKRAFRLEASGFVQRAAADASSPVSIDLLDNDRRIIATHHCFHSRPQPSGCGCGGGRRVPIEREPYIEFVETIEWPGDRVAALAFHRGEAPFAVVDVGEPPTVEIEGPEQREDRLVVRVRAAHRRETPTVAVLFTADDGVTWQPVGFDPPDGELSVEAARLPGGERCRFRAIAGAELQSAVADTEPFAVPRSPRRVFVVAPGSDCGIAPGPVAVRAMIDTRGLGPVEPHEIRWSSSIQGELGAGYDLTAEFEEGEHIVTATIPDGLGGLVSERAIIIVGGRPADSIR